MVAKPSKNKKSAAPSTALPVATETQAEQQLPRFVVDGDGTILYATRAFAALIDKSAPDGLSGQRLAALIEFTNPDDALRSQSLFSAGGGRYIDGIVEGAHEVRLGGQDTAHLFQFDKITAGDGREYMVGAQVEGDQAEAEADFSAFTTRALQLIEEQRQQGTPSAGKTSGKKITGRTAEGELRHFLNMSNDVMSISHRDGTFSRVNVSFNKILGYKDEELRRMGFIDLVHPDDRHHIRTLLQNVMRDESDDGQIIDFESRVIARDNSVHWIEWRQKRSGDVIYSVGRDVTAIKEHEAALRKQELQLSEAQAIGRMGHWRWQVGADSIEWSNEIYRIFGVEKDKFEPTLDSMNALLHKRDIGRMMQAFQRAIIEQNNYEMDFRAVRPDGEVRYIRCEGKCERDESGEVIALFGIMQDLTERTLYEIELREAKESAEAAYASKSQFLANMSHELRTPLNAIIGFSEMMQRQLLGPIGTEKYIDYIAGIRESGEHLLDLISDILDMSKIEAGKYELDLEEINIVKVIRLAVHMMEGRAVDAKIKIVIDVPQDDMQMVADRRAVMQILLNILSNAVKFTDPGGAVRIECIERPDYLSIKIHDTGIGIPANKLKCITRPFEQAASHYTREHQGTGLGLAITKDLVELHGGSLHIESTVGKGTTVTVRMPYNAYTHLKNKKD